MKRFEENTRSGNFSLKRRVLKSKISKTFNVFFAFFLAAAVVLCYVYPVSLASAADGTGTIDDPRLNLSDPIAHEKTITDNGDGTYTVTLNVTGEVKKTETTPMADVVIVFDRSNSMNTTADGYNNTRLDVAKEATDNLVTKLLTSDTVDARVSLVDFDTYARTYTESGADKDADATAKWYEKDDLTTLTGTIDGIDAPSDNQGATNWEDAMVHT
ncbi:MAG: VWA domain-containing protein, partial [Coriobacteriales bacterium]